MKRILSMLLSTAIICGMTAVPVSSQQNIYSAYLQVLNEAVQKYGAFERKGYEYCTGVGYVNLIDFDNDGIEELLFCTGDAFSYREYDYEYTYHIYTYKNGKAELVTEDSMEAHSGTVNWEISLWISGGDNVKLSKSRYDDIACESEYITFYEYDGGSWIEDKDAFATVAVETEPGCYFHEYYIYGEKVSEAEYNSRLNSISRKDHITINSINFSGDYLEEVGAGLSDSSNNGAAIIQVQLNGEDIVFDQPPIIVNDRTLVPMRAIFEAMECEVEWYDGVIDVYKEDECIMTLWIGKNEIWTSEDGYFSIDTAPIIVNDRTLVPVRVISESMGAEVIWDDDTKTVQIIMEADQDGSSVELQTGDYLIFGENPNLNVPLYWTVLETYEDEAFILADTTYCNLEYGCDESSINSFLKLIYEKSFTDEERSIIKPTYLDDIEEEKELFVLSEEEYDEYAWWTDYSYFVLRFSGEDTVYVNDYGVTDEYCGNWLNVRPACYIDLGKIKINAGDGGRFTSAYSFTIE